MLELRWYQSEAVNAVYEHIRSKDNNPCVVLPTGAGKSLVIAKLVTDIVREWSSRVIVLQHVKELIEQNAEKIRALCPDIPVGIYSAGLGKREHDAPCVVAGIQSVYQKAFDVAPFDVAIVDEAHLIPPDGDGMYRRFLQDSKKAVPHLRVVGLTATPYRMQTGYICEPENILNEICYEVGVKELIQQGFLSRLTSKEPIRLDTSGLHVRGGEFVADEAERLMLDNVGPAVREIIERTQERRSVLVFCQSIEHAVQVSNLIREGCLCRVELVTGDTPSEKRAEYLRDFKARQIKFLVNVNVLTTGFDAPNVDCVALLRPTLSPGLYYQMVGRGFRICDGKENALILDFAGNIRQHGPVDQITPKPRKINGGEKGDAPVKQCPQCEEMVHAAYSACPNCGHEFPPDTAKHDPTAGTAPVLSDEESVEEWDVLDVKYSEHRKKNAPDDAPRTMRVDYRCNPFLWVAEWVCIEHDGFARRKAVQWWNARSNDPFPKSAQHAVDIANAGGLAPPLRIWVANKAGEKFPTIKKVEIGEKPEGVAPEDADEEWEFPNKDDQQEFNKFIANW